MEDKPRALEQCARMNNQRMTMRDIPELMELVTAMLFASDAGMGASCS